MKTSLAGSSLVDADESSHTLVAQSHGFEDVHETTIETAIAVAKKASSSRDANICDEALKFVKEVIADTQQHPKLSIALNMVGVLLSTKWMKTREPELLQEALDYYHKALAMKPSSSVDMSNIANLMLSGMMHLNNPDALAEITSYAEKAVILTSHNPASREWCLRVLARVHIAAFRENGDFSRLDQALPVCREALVLQPKGANDLSALKLLLEILAVHYAHTGDIKVLEEATKLRERENST